MHGSKMIAIHKYITSVITLKTINDKLITVISFIIPMILIMAT